MQLEEVHFKKERPVSFIKRLHNYEGIQRTKLKTVRGKMYSLDYIQYIICFLFFVYKCKLCISSFVITIKYMVNITRIELRKVSTHTLRGEKPLLQMFEIQFKTIYRVPHVLMQTFHI